MTDKYTEIFRLKKMLEEVEDYSNSLVTELKK